MWALILRSKKIVLQGGTRIANKNKENGITVKLIISSKIKCGGTTKYMYFHMGHYFLEN